MNTLIIIIMEIKRIKWEGLCQKDSVWLLYQVQHRLIITIFVFFTDWKRDRQRKMPHLITESPKSTASNTYSQKARNFSTTKVAPKTHSQNTRNKQPQKLILKIAGTSSPKSSFSEFQEQRAPQAHCQNTISSLKSYFPEYCGTIVPKVISRIPWRPTDIEESWRWFVKVLIPIITTRSDWVLIISALSTAQQ